MEDDDINRVEQMYNLAVKKRRRRHFATEPPAVKCTKSLTTKHFWLSHVPAALWLPKYKFKTNLEVDITAGLTVGFMALPQG